MPRMSVERPLQIDGSFRKLQMEASGREAPSARCLPQPQGRLEPQGLACREEERERTE